MYYIYIVECKDGTLYTGWTTNVADRIEKHNQGKGAKYTKMRRPVHLKYHEELATKNAAMQREYFIKSLTRAEKLELVNKNK